MQKMLSIFWIQRYEKTKNTFSKNRRHEYWEKEDFFWRGDFSDRFSARKKVIHVFLLTEAKT